MALGCALMAIGTSATAQCLVGKLLANDSASNDQFAYSVAINGDVCVIGARLDDTPVINSGSAYVFRFDALSGSWTQEAKLIASDAANGDEFGFSVAVYSNPINSGLGFGGGGDVIVVGARHDDDHGTDSGSAYVFTHNGTSWSQTAKLSPADGAASDRFGYSVAISGDFILVGARDDDAPSTNSGSVYAYHWNGTSWTQQAKLTPSDAAANDQFGVSLAMAPTEAGAGAVAIVGSWHDDSPASDAGSAYIFRYKSRTNSWAQGAKLTSSDPAASDEFGVSVAISATDLQEVALVGARNDDDAGANSGSAYVYRHVGTSWVQEAKLKAADGAAGDLFASAVALTSDGETAMVGAPQNDQAALDAGAIYVFRHQEIPSSWSQIGKYMPATTSGDLGGAAVAASSARAVVSGSQVDDGGVDSGAAYLYSGVNGVDNNDNGVPDGCDVPGDVTGDGVVDLADLTAVITAWGMCPTPPIACPADLDGNGLVDVYDLLIVVQHWS